MTEEERSRITNADLSEVQKMACLDFLRTDVEDRKTSSESSVSKCNSSPTNIK